MNDIKAYKHGGTVYIDMLFVDPAKMKLKPQALLRVFPGMKTVYPGIRNRKLTSCFYYIKRKEDIFPSIEVFVRALQPSVQNRPKQTLCLTDREQFFALRCPGVNRFV